MSTLFYANSPDLGAAPAGLQQLRAKFGPGAAVLAAHLVLFYAAYSGMLTRIVDAAIPDAVMVSFVEAPVQPPPAAPKVVPVVQLPPPALPQVPIPVVQIAQQQNVITTVQTSAPAEVRAVTPAPAHAAVAVAAAPVAAPVPTTPPTITSGIEYIKEIQPLYPQMSKRMGEQGRVTLRILINEKGTPEQAQVLNSSGSQRLDEAGRQAALRCLFKPYIKDGRAMAVFAIVPVNFTLST